MYIHINRRITDITRVYRFIVGELETEDETLESLVENFHAHLDNLSEVEIPKHFGPQDLQCRCLLGAIAFGLGIQIPNIKHIIHWKPYQTAMDYWQELGHCARDPNFSGKQFFLHFHIAKFLKL